MASCLKVYFSHSKSGAGGGGEGGVLPRMPQATRAEKEKGWSVLQGILPELPLHFLSHLIGQMQSHGLAFKWQRGAGKYRMPWKERAGFDEHQ